MQYVYTVSADFLTTQCLCQWTFLLAMRVSRERIDRQQKTSVTDIKARYFMSALLNESYPNNYWLLYQLFQIFYNPLLECQSNMFRIHNKDNIKHYLNYYDFFENKSGLLVLDDILPERQLRRTLVFSNYILSCEQVVRVGVAGQVVVDACARALRCNRQVTQSRGKLGVFRNFSPGVALARVAMASSCTWLLTRVCWKLVMQVRWCPGLLVWFLCCRSLLPSFESFILFHFQIIFLFFMVLLHCYVWCYFLFSRQLTVWLRLCLRFIDFLYFIFSAILTKAGAKQRTQFLWRQMTVNMSVCMYTNVMSPHSSLNDLCCVFVHLKTLGHRSSHSKHKWVTAATWS